MRYTLQDFRCNDCKHVFEELVEGDEAPVCPKCGGATKVLIGGGPTNLFHQSMFPYFDRAFGCEVTSPGHRAELCRRFGVQAVDGDYDVRRDLGVAEADARREREIAEYDRYEAQIRQDPFVREYLAKQAEAARNGTYKRAEG